KMMKTLVIATRTRLALAVAALTMASVAARAEEDGIRWVNCTPAGLFTDPQQFGPKPLPAWKQHSWDRDGLLEWDEATNSWKQSVTNPTQHLPASPAPEYLPFEDTFLPFDAPVTPSVPDLGVPDRPDRTYGMNQGWRNDCLDWVSEMPPAPPVQPVPVAPAVPQQGRAGQPETSVNWGGLLGGVADSLGETVDSIETRRSTYSTLFSR
ncbi:MAG: hypothetical protein KJZ78_29420, partial [Bryobacteraceae bacterium]|nr:hypothetical protein [Bryobacteraceae bacterium]